MGRRATNAVVILLMAMLLVVSIWFGAQLGAPFAEQFGPTASTTSPVVIMVVIQPPLAAQNPEPPSPGQPPTTTVVTAPTPNTTQTPGPEPEPEPVLEIQPAVEQVILSSTNSLRTGAGLAPLAVDAGLQTYARAWATHMATTGAVEHSAIETLLDGWVSVGENVGSGDQAQAIFQALVASAPHQSIMLGDFTDGGVGAVLDEDGVLWICQVFASETLPTTTTTTTTTTTAPEVTVTVTLNTSTLPEVTVPTLP